MAGPEKALVDFLYLGGARSKLFCSLPELEIPAEFSVRRARAFIRRIPSSRHRTRVRVRFEKLALLRD